jgi:hypothetical protein
VNSHIELAMPVTLMSNSVIGVASSGTAMRGGLNTWRDEFRSSDGQA